MTILHRPPSQLLQKPGSSLDRDDIEICYESLGAMLSLLRGYARFYSYRCLPLDFVQTLSTAAGTILMRRHINNLPWGDAETTRSLDLVIQAMEDIKDTWPCVKEILNSVLKARQTETSTLPDVDPVMLDFDFLSAAQPPLSDVDGTTWPTSFGNMLTGSLLPWDHVAPGEASFDGTTA
jgi:hypothetical protein